jgi:transposase
MTTAPMIIGIDLGTNWFHLIGLDERGGTVLRRKMNRTQRAAFAVTASQCVVATEACPGSQYWGRIFATAGHEVRILPAQFVKPYVKANKTTLTRRRPAPKPQAA